MKTFHFFILLVLTNVTLAQNYFEVGSKKYYFGCIQNDTSYAKIPESKLVKSRGMETIPNSISYDKYLPKAGNQEATGTCTSWATAYYTLSILYNITKIDLRQKNEFSPFFLYNNIKHRKDSSCEDGISIEDALNFLKYKGCLPGKLYLSQCKINKDEDKKLWDIALSYRIKDFKRIGQENRIQRIKKALNLKKAIVISIKTPRSFVNSLNGDTWDGIFDYNRGLHALSLIGYDDNKEGGSFEIINSWGGEWGDRGRLWVKYSDFDKIITQVFEITGYNQNELKRFSTRNNYDGEIKIFDKKGKQLPQIKNIDMLDDILIDSTINNMDTSKKVIDSTFNFSDTLIDNIDTSSLELDPLPILDNFTPIIPEITEFNFKYSSQLNSNEFKFKISSKDSAYMYFFVFDESEQTATPITKNNNSIILLNKKKSDIILPETEYLKGPFFKKYILLMSKEVINDLTIEKMCLKKYENAKEFINFNFANELVLQSPEVNDYNTSFILKNDPGKILPIIINIVY
jgi:hypothetical protein